MKADIFKICIVIILVGFLFVFYKFYREFCLYSQNGRFVPYDASPLIFIIDTRTGEYYCPEFVYDELEDEERLFKKASKALIEDTKEQKDETH